MSVQSEKHITRWFSWLRHSEQTAACVNRKNQSDMPSTLIDRYITCQKTAKIPLFNVTSKKISKIWSMKQFNKINHVHSWWVWLYLDYLYKYHYPWYKTVTIKKGPTCR